MRERLEARLAELQRELDIGERRLRLLEAEQAQLRDTLLRIDGALELLRELLRDDEARTEPSTPVTSELLAPSPGSDARH